MAEDFNAIENIRSILWRQLRPGMVIVGGVEINDVMPYELRDYPVLTNDILNELSSKYQFLEKRKLLVADICPASRPGEVSLKMRKAEAQVRALLSMREEFHRERLLLERQYGIGSVGSILRSRAVEASFLLQDRSNSFAFPYAVDTEALSGLGLPSFFFEAELKQKIGELLMGRLSGSLHIPDDMPVTLHLVVDYSFSMKQHGKLEIAASAANYLAERLPQILGNTRIYRYAFSSICRRTATPLVGREIPKKDTNYSSFFREVLKHRDRERHNKIVVITDGIPTDFSEAMEMGVLVQKARIDYTQIMLSMSEQFTEILDRTEDITVRDRIADPDTIPEDAECREYTEEEVVETHKRIGANFTSVADACNGNQIVLKVDPSLRNVVVEVFDRYMGLMTVAEGLHRTPH